MMANFTSKLCTATWAASAMLLACAACNLRKADRLLEETHMRLLRPPRPPAPVLFISLALHAVPETWRQYLPGLDDAAPATATAAA